MTAFLTEIAVDVLPVLGQLSAASRRFGPRPKPSPLGMTLLLVVAIVILAAVAVHIAKRMFTAAQVRSLIESAEPAMKAAILLGINGGFGNTDCAALPRAAVNLKGGVIDFERPKTGVRRIVPLWPETVAGLKVVLATESPLPTTGAETRVVFHSESGLPLVRQIVKRGKNDEIEKVTYIDRLGDWFDDLLVDKKLKRKRVGFYTLRHTFRTWADETNDQHAIHVIMGHSIPGMSGVYIEEIDLKRLRRVVNHVRRKLWPNANERASQSAGQELAD